MLHHFCILVKKNKNTVGTTGGYLNLYSSHPKDHEIYIHQQRSLTNAEIKQQGKPWGYFEVVVELILSAGGY